jgi:hypothetical protein
VVWRGFDEELRKLLKTRWVPIFAKETRDRVCPQRSAYLSRTRSGIQPHMCMECSANE